MQKKLFLPYLNTLTFSCIQMVLYTTIPYIAEQTGVATANIILAISIGSLIFSFMGPFWAAKSDKWGRKQVLSLGMFGMCLSFAFLCSIFLFNEELSLSLKVAAVFASRIVYGLLCSAIVPVSQAWQLDLYPQDQHLKVLTRNSMCLNLGRILGPILVLAKQVNFELVIYIATVWVLILAIIVFSTSSKAPASFHVQETNFKDILDGWKVSIRESLMPILLAMIFTSFVGILHSFLGHHLKTVLSISGKEATLMFAKIILVLSLMAIIFQQLSIMVFKAKWQPRVVIGSLSIVIGTYMMMLATSIEMIWTSIGFVAMATALIPPAYLSLTSHSKENTEKTNVFGKKLGLASVAHSLGYAIGAGLIALSMKMKVVPESYVTLFVSLFILVLSLMMILKQSSAKALHA